MPIALEINTHHIFQVAVTDCPNTEIGTHAVLQVQGLNLSRKTVCPDLDFRGFSHSLQISTRLALNLAIFLPHPFRFISRNCLLVSLYIKYAAASATLNSLRVTSDLCKMQGARQCSHCSSLSAVHTFTQSSHTSNAFVPVNVKPLRCSSFLNSLFH
jgi:hypothetical protein